MEKMGVLGPKGTYSEMAASAAFGGKAEMVTYPLISDVVGAVARGEIDSGVIPVESMREGSVAEALDALVWCKVKIKAEIVVSISHALLAVKGAKIGKIAKVLSHPQALAQCRDWLRKNIPHAELVEMPSTSKAAEQLSKINRLNAAVIGPTNLAKIYGLRVLLEDIKTGESNKTRFFQIAKRDHERTGHDKTSIVFATKADRPGILHKILGEFASRKINLTKIESRPSKRALGDYLFFVDFEGHREEAKVMQALRGIKKSTAMLKVLGSYPKKF